MSDTPPFTAQQIRDLLPLLEKSMSFANDMTGYYQSQFIGSNAERVSSDAESEAAMAPVETAAAMLEQFAQRLEQEEQQQTAFAATEGAAYAIVPHGAAEALREEGRQQERAKPLEVLQADNGDVLICYQPAGAYPASPVPFHDMRAGEQAKNAKSGEVMGQTPETP